MAQVSLQCIREATDSLPFKFKTFLIREDEQVFELQVDKRKFKLFKRDPLNKSKSFLTSTALPLWPLSAAIWTPTRHPSWPTYLSTSIVACLTEDAQIVLLAINAETFEPVTVGVIDLLAEPEVREAFVSGCMMTPQMATPASGAPACGVSALKWVDLGHQSSLLFAELLPGLFVGLRLSLGRRGRPKADEETAISFIDKIYVPTSPGMGSPVGEVAKGLTAQTRETDLPSDDEHSQSSLTSSLGDAPGSPEELAEHPAEVVELLQTCECHSVLVPEDLETTKTAAEMRRRRNGLHLLSEDSVRHLMMPLVLSLEESFLLDYLEDCTATAQARLHRRRANRRVPSWEVTVSAGGHSLDLLVLEGAASQVMTMDAVEPSKLVRLAINYVTGIGWLCSTENVWPHLPWDALSVCLLQRMDTSDDSASYSPLSSEEVAAAGARPEENHSSLTNAIWVLSPKTIHLIHQNDRSEDCAITLHPDLRNLSEQAMVKSSLMAVCVGEQVDMKVMRGLKTGRYIANYACNVKLLLTGKVSRLTPATFMMEFENENSGFTEGNRKPGLLLKIDHEDPVHTPSIRLSVVSSALLDDGISGLTTVSPNVLDSEAAFLHAGSPMQDSLETSPATSVADERELDFWASINAAIPKPLFRLEGSIHNIPSVPGPSRIIRDACAIHNAGVTEGASVEYLSLEDVRDGMAEASHMDLVVCQSSLPLQAASVREAPDVVTLWHFLLDGRSNLLVMSCDSLEARPLGTTRLYKCPAEMDEDDGLLEYPFDGCAIEVSPGSLDAENFTLECALLRPGRENDPFFVQITPSAIIIIRFEQDWQSTTLVNACDFSPTFEDISENPEFIVGPLATQARVALIDHVTLSIRVRFEDDLIRSWIVRCTPDGENASFEECFDHTVEIIGPQEAGKYLSLETLSFAKKSSSASPSVMASPSEVDASETCVVMADQAEEEALVRASEIYREICRKLSQKIETRRAHTTSCDRQAEREIGRMGGMVDVNLSATVSAQDETDEDEAVRSLKCLVIRSSSSNDQSLLGIYLTAGFMSHPLTDILSPTLSHLAPQEAAEMLLTQCDSFTPSNLEAAEISDAATTAEPLSTSNVASLLAQQADKLLTAHIMLECGERSILMLLFAGVRPLFYVRHSLGQPYVFTLPGHWQALPVIEKISKPWRLTRSNLQLVSGDTVLVQTDCSLCFLAVWDTKRGLSVHALSLTLSPIVSGGPLNKRVPIHSIALLEKRGFFLAVDEPGRLALCTPTPNIVDLQHLTSGALEWQLVNGLLECRARIQTVQPNRQACQVFTFADAMRGAAGPTYLALISRERKSSRKLLMDLLVGENRVTLDSRVGDVVGQMKRAASYWQTSQEETPEIHYWQYRAELRGAEMPEPVIIDLQPLEVALCMATSHVGALTVVAIGSAFTHFGLAPARGRLILGILGPNGSIELGSLSSYYVAGAVTAMGAFRPPSSKSQFDGYPDRHLFYFSGGCRLYLQELVIDEARKVNVTGGSFFECRASITKVQPIKSYFVITTVDGVEFVMFRLSPHKATTTYLPVSLQGLGASMQKKGIPLCGAACQALVKQSQLGVLTGDYFGNLMLFDFLPAKPTTSLPYMDSLESVKSKAPMLRLLDAVRVAQTPWLRILPQTIGTAMQRAICLAADGGIWIAELRQESARDQLDRAEIFAARFKLVKRQFIRPRGNPNFGWDDLQPDSIHEAWERAPTFRF